MASTAVSRADQHIQQDVLDELTWEPNVTPTEVGVTVSEGVVVLTGSVDSYAKKWAAERAAHRVHRVRAVANEMEVRLPTAAHRTDAEIATAATRTLEWDAFVPVEHLDVTVANGWITVRGQVEWEYQRRAAERSLRKLAGVRGVSNGILVRPIGSEQDQLEQQLAGALSRSLADGAEQVSVEVEGDTIVLDGLVRSWAQREEAERVAWASPGIAEVRNQLTVVL
ncbi:BON domain-containing protein [Melissospora conviva]|uniref:BON domain-containing protein n=1 Tax=Melissospora conviva TaxID=3388432 RepID=UPI003B76C9CC